MSRRWKKKEVESGRRCRCTSCASRRRINHYKNEKRKDENEKKMYKDMNRFGRFLVKEKLMK